MDEIPMDKEQVAANEGVVTQAQKDANENLRRQIAERESRERQVKDPRSSFSNKTQSDGLAARLGGKE